VESVAVVMGRRIRKLRELVGLNQTELATRALVSKSHISDVERGEAIPKLETLTLIDQAVGGHGVLLDFYDLLNIGIQESATVADAERDAVGITDWELRAVPGLLQAASYMGELLRSDLPPARVQREVNIRLARQKILKSLVAGWFIIDEAVLMRQYGAQEVMREQLLMLEAVNDQPNLYLQVMPFTSTRHPGSDGPLRVVEYRDKPAVWFTEGARSGRMSDEREETMHASATLNLIRAAALPVHESVQYIRAIRESRYERSVA
jgi:transcriptional regulator with XRE-family HTH domain